MGRVCTDCNQTAFSFTGNVLFWTTVKPKEIWFPSLETSVLICTETRVKIILFVAGRKMM